MRKKDSLEALAILATPTANANTPLRKAGLVGPSSAVRVITATEEESITRELGPEDIEANRENLAVRFAEETTPRILNKNAQRTENRNKTITTKKQSKG